MAKLTKSLETVTPLLPLGCTTLLTCCKLSVGNATHHSSFRHRNTSPQHSVFLLRNNLRASTIVGLPTNLLTLCEVPEDPRFTILLCESLLLTFLCPFPSAIQFLPHGLVKVQQLYNILAIKQGTSTSDSGQPLFQ